MQIREATAADLPACYDLWYANEVDDLPIGQRPEPGHNPLHGHVLTTGRLLVAESDDGRVHGFAGALQRDDLWFLSDLFVDPGVHEAGVGRRLLTAALDGAPPRRVVLSSDDPRAIAVYARAGMLPRWPSFDLYADGDAVARLAVAPDPADGIGLRVERAAIVTVTALDHAWTGIDRGRDLTYWSREPQTELVTIRSRADRPIGWALLRGTVPGAIHRRGAALVSPVVLAPGTTAETVRAAVGATIHRAAAAWGRPLRLTLPGPHPALPDALTAGFRIVGTDYFGASAADLVDPTVRSVSKDLL